MFFLIPIILLVFIFLLIFLNRLTVKIKGERGEKKISHILASLPEQYKVINNVLIPTTTSTTQIDHIVLSPYGIFVIETKNYRGWIFGNEDKDFWIQIIFNYKGQFRNPIQQNMGHIKALKHLLRNFEDIPFISIIVFSDKCTLKTNIKSDVVYFSEVNKTILRYKQEVLSAARIAEAYQIIQKANIVDGNHRALHVRTAKSIAQNNANGRVYKICPQCGGNLVKRDGKYGTFWGCKNYPKCRYTKKIACLKK